MALTLKGHAIFLGWIDLGPISKLDNVLII